MNRRDAILKLSGLTGFPLVLAGCSMDSVRRAEANLGWRMRQPGTGIQFTGLPEVVKVIILATYPPTPVQAQVAEQRARQAVATIATRERKKVARTKPRVPEGTPGRKEDAVVVTDQAASLPSDDTKVAAAILQQQTGTTVIAVDTQPDSRLQGSRAVMLWNTQTQRFVGNNVYDISSPPAKGQVAQWGSTTARYVGSGSL